MFMAPGYRIECGSKFNWPKRKDELNVLQEDILCKVSEHLEVASG